jgi:hypothetical protein
MGLYPGSSCPDHPFPKELSMVEVDTRIHKLLDLRVTLNHRVSPILLR